MKIKSLNMQGNRDSLVINYKKKKVHGEFRVIGFEDHGHHIAYISSLNLSGYGNTPQEALEMLMKVVVSDFCENILSLPEYMITEEMEKLGWKRGKLLRKTFSTSAYVDKEGILRNFNLSPDTKVSESVLQV